MDDGCADAVGLTDGAVIVGLTAGVGLDEGVPFVTLTDDVGFSEIVPVVSLPFGFVAAGLQPNMVMVRRITTAIVQNRFFKTAPLFRTGHEVTSALSE